VIGQVAEALAIAQEGDLATVRAEGIALEAATCPAAAAEIEMLSGVVRADTTDPAPGPTGTVAPPAWDLGAEVLAVGVVVAAAVVDGADEFFKSADMKSVFANQQFVRTLGICVAAGLTSLCAAVFAAGQQPATQQTTPVKVVAAQGAKAFDSPQQAADALIGAAEKFDQAALIRIFGPDGDDVVFSGEYAQDREHAANFVAEAHEKKSVSVDPKSNGRAFLLVGNEDWPFPVPIVKRNGKWFFDAKAGLQELLYRRIGANELDAIQICHGYVEAQYDYAFQKREGYDVNQYAQRIISHPGKQDGLAWQNSDGTWAGPVGDKIARAIEQGYTIEAEPYHGYFFKILKGQGPAAPLGQMDYLVKGVMIGGFALVASPAEYAVTGVRTFIVSQDGVVYDRDLGPGTLDTFKTMELFNPDNSWTPVLDQSH
jgi:Protein of unknown function (DUF2950)